MAAEEQVERPLVTLTFFPGAESSPGRRARYSLSTRALLELLPYLKSNYPEECLECTICFEVGFFLP